MDDVSMMQPIYNQLYIRQDSMHVTEGADALVELGNFAIMISGDPLGQFQAPIISNNVADS